MIHITDKILSFFISCQINSFYFDIDRCKKFKIFSKIQKFHDYLLNYLLSKIDFEKKQADNLKNKGLMYVYLMEVDEKIYPDLTKAKDGNEHSECNYFTLKNNPIEDKNDQLYILIKNILSKT